MAEAYLAKTVTIRVRVKDQETALLVRKLFFETIPKKQSFMAFTKSDLENEGYWFVYSSEEIPYLEKLTEIEWVIQKISEGYSLEDTTWELER